MYNKGVVNMKTLIIDIETKSLEPWEDGEIVCIGVMDLDTGKITQFFGDDEKEFLKEFFEWFHEKEYKKVIGYNVGFDFRYIFGRAMKYGISANGFFRRSIIVDLMGIMKSVRSMMYTMNKPGKLNQWSELCFGSGKIRLSDSIADLFEQGKISDILTYNAQDLRITAELYKRTMKVFGDE